MSLLKLFMGAEVVSERTLSRKKNRARIRTREQLAEHLGVALNTIEQQHFRVWDDPEGSVVAHGPLFYNKDSIFRQPIAHYCAACEKIIPEKPVTLDYHRNSRSLINHDPNYFKCQECPSVLPEVCDKF